MVFPGRYADLIQPDKLHVLSVSPLVDQLRITRGGVAGNIAYSLALLGEKPRLIASIGDDETRYLKALAQLGVDVSQVHVSNLPTAAFHVLTDQADCQIGGFYPGAMGDAQALTLTGKVTADDLIVISAHDPQMMSQQVDECLKLNLRLFFDVGQQSLVLSQEVLQSGIAAAELLIVNDYEMGLLEKKTGWSAAEICRRVDVCVVTEGSKGCRVVESGRNYHLTAVKAQPAVDPTGAGDAFRAGFLYGYVRQWPVLACAQLGVVVATYAVEKLGTQEHTFTKDDINNRHFSAFGNKINWS